MYKLKKFFENNYGKIAISALAVMIVLTSCLIFSNVRLSNTNGDLYDSYSNIVSENSTLTAKNAELSTTVGNFNAGIDRLQATIEEQENTISELESTIGSLKISNSDQSETISGLRGQFDTIKDSIPVQVTVVLKSTETETYELSWWAFATPSNQTEIALESNTMSIVDPIISISLYVPASDNLRHIYDREEGCTYFPDEDGNFALQLAEGELGSYCFDGKFQLCFESCQEHSFFLTFSTTSGAL